MPQNIGIVIVEKTGVTKSLTIKEYNEEELYKKCGFKKATDFSKQTEWIVKLEGKKYLVSLYGKIDGKANTENKYDFPPPVDSTLFFGSCALTCMLMQEDKTFLLTSLSVEMWTKMYEKLFGGFEDLAATAAQDEMEVDELAGIPKEKKTKDGYLKDGFVVDSDEGDEDGGGEEYSSEGDDEESDELEDSNEPDDDDLDLEDIGSELSSEEYDDSSDSDSSDSASGSDSGSDSDDKKKKDKKNK